MCSAMDTKEGGCQRASWSACSSEPSPSPLSSPSHAREGGGVEGAGTKEASAKEARSFTGFEKGLQNKCTPRGVVAEVGRGRRWFGAYVDEHGQGTKHNHCVEGSIKRRATPSLLVYAIPPVCMVALQP